MMMLWSSWISLLLPLLLLFVCSFSYELPFLPPMSHKSNPCNTTVPENAPKTVLVGYLSPSLVFFRTLAQFSFEQLNADECILPGTTVVPIINYTGLTNVVESFEQFLYQAEVQHVVAVVGPLTGDACRVTAVTSPLFQIPQVHPSFFYFF
jgi:hypothetical protein